MAVKQLALTSINIEGGTQSRVCLNQEVVSEYAEILREGGELPPAEVLFDGTDYWLWDGFHRYFSHQGADIESMPCSIERGTLREAILKAMGANAAHGLKRTNDDKRKAVETLLKDEEWSQWSDNEIASRIGVSQPFVLKLRKALTYNVISENGDHGRKYVTKHGTEAVMKTGNIGTNKKASPVEKSPAPNEPKSERKISGGITFDPTEWEGDDETEVVVEGEEISPMEAGPIDAAKVKLLDLPFRQAMTNFRGSFDDFVAAMQGEHLALYEGYIGLNRIEELRARVENVITLIKFHRPVEPCRKCSGSGCHACNQTGWWPKHKQLSYTAEKKGG